MSKKKRNETLYPVTPRRNSGNKKSKTKTFSLWRFVFKWMFILALWGGIFAVGVLAWFAKDLPEIAKKAQFTKQASILVKANDGSIIARYGEMKGSVVSIKDMPDNLVHAVIATEDRRFYSHFGIDPIGISRAIVTNAVKGRLSQGGSTITQQLAKNLFLTHDRNLTRKIQEALLALWLEHDLSKDDILTAYMNRVYLGSGVYGMPAAAQLYFGKNIKDLNLRECAILAGLLKAPSRYSPLNNPDLAKERSDVVLEAMLDAGYITKNDIKTARTQVATNRKPAGGKASRYFADWVVDGMDDLVGTPDMDVIIETTLDPVVQDSAETALNKVIAQAGAEKHITQGAVMVMRPDGAVITMVGGRDYAISEFNRATQALRSPGSSFKPFVFLAALRQGWLPTSPVLDAPITEGKYRPENYGNKYYGHVSMAQALAMSMNTATLRIAQSIGLNAVLSTAKDLGIISKLESDYSVTLGSSGISMMEMATAYAIISNGGTRVFPYAITKISNSEGRVLYERETPSGFYQVIEPQYARAITNMMRGVIDFGTGKKAQLPFPASGKTGTSQDSRDAWFTGFTDRIVATVWLGNDNNSPMKNVTGGSYPAQIWHDVMLTANGRYAPVSYAAYDLPTYVGNAEYAQDTQTDNTSAQSNDDSISGLLGRLLNSTEPATTHKQVSQSSGSQNNKSKNDYSNLNQ